jgi:glycosyltransferase involved in cell wall biosynthesis
MRVSIVTPAFRSIATLKDNIQSVKEQSYQQIEHIVVDGGSKDGSVELLSHYASSRLRFISEPDHGIYDAFNKGIKISEGDVIGILNSDDVYANKDVIKRVIQVFHSTDCEIVYADLEYVSVTDSSRVVRYYSSKGFQVSSLKWGFIPAHPTVFLRRDVYEKVGLFNDSYKIAGDFEFLSRVFLSNQFTSHYIPEVLVKMRTGGTSNSSLRQRWKCNLEVLRACRENKIPSNLAMLSLRYVPKLFEFKALFSKSRS